MYKISKSTSYGIEYTTIIRTSDGAGIPLDPDNTDYQVYLEWVKTNTAEVLNDTLTWDSIRVTRDQILRDTDWTIY